MIEQKLNNILRSMNENKNFVEMLIRLEKPIEKLPVCKNNSLIDSFYKENKKIVDNREVLRKLNEAADQLENKTKIEIISQSISRLKEFDFPIPENIILRWNQINQKFDYVKQTSLSLSIGTSIFDLEHFPAGSDDGVLKVDTTSIFIENTNSQLYGIYHHQTNGTINLDTHQNYTTFYVYGTGVIFSKTGFSLFNHRIINVDKTTELHFDGDLSFDWSPTDTGYFFFELAGSPNTPLGNSFFFVGY